MSKSRVIVLSAVRQGLSIAEAARRFGVTWRWVHELVRRYEAGGLDALEPRPRRPRTNPNQVEAVLRERIIELRTTLTEAGWDAGPATIAAHLERDGTPAPAISTIRRILLDAQLITREPNKRPRAAMIRFEAHQPNELWQSDFTHWRLADGTDIEILNWLDDHSRLLLACTAHRPVTGAAVIESFTATIATHGTPAATLTDNGRVFTTRITGTRNGFEQLIASLGIQQRNGRPFHPQTQGKIERFHQTLKRWLAAQPAADDLTALQDQLDRFRHHYNHHRPHRALGRRTPQTAYDATIKATPADNRDQRDWRIRHDRVDRFGKLSLRRAGRMHHLGIGIDHAGTPVMILTDDTTVTVTDRATGEVLATHTVDPARTYWRNNDRSPGRWPGLLPDMNDDAEHL
ncbi:IS481 family transposase [Agrococcus sediminis]|uniref:IS481 family transposase n=1 Tax=Agrococcus sediminis TaxID=2599924 RepID=UPI00380D93C3